MNHCGTKRIETVRLILSPFEEKDADSVFVNYASHLDNVLHVTWPAHTSIDVTKHLVEMWEKDYASNKQYKWAITKKETPNEVIGDISVKVNEEIKSGDIGYIISHKYWNQGITTEAFIAVINYLFHQADFQRLSARHSVDNPASGKVMLKVGMRYVGMMRKSDINNQGIVDMQVYELLKEDWQETIL